MSIRMSMLIEIVVNPIEQFTNGQKISVVHVFSRHAIKGLKVGYFV